jgi:PleD family two-component response regulator
VSIGAARRLENERTAREAVSRADQALYSAKRGGRNRSMVHAEDALPLAG